MDNIFQVIMTATVDQHRDKYLKDLLKVTQQSEWESGDLNLWPPDFKGHILTMMSHAYSDTNTSADAVTFRYDKMGALTQRLAQRGLLKT